MDPSLAPLPEPSLSEWERSYRSLYHYIAQSLDYYKAELSVILFPFYVYIFCKLIKSNKVEAAHQFLENFKHHHEAQHHATLQQLRTVHSLQHVVDSEVAQQYLNTRHKLIIRSYALDLLVSHLHSHGLRYVLKFINDHMSIKKVPTSSRLFFQEENLEPILWGCSIESPLDSTLDVDSESRKRKGDGSFVAPVEKLTDLPGPVPPKPLSTTPSTTSELHQHNINYSNRYNCSSSNLPSIMQYAVVGMEHCTSMNLMSDGSAVAVGFDDSTATVYDIEALSRAQTPRNSSDQAIDRVSLSGVDTADGVVRLIGHSAPVSDLCFCPRSPERSLLTSSLNGDVRYWLCPQLHSSDAPKSRCLAVFNCHQFPIYSMASFDVGMYFVTGSHDKTAKLFSLERHRPLRVMDDHFGPVTTVQSHPNTAYVATGSTDRHVRLYDVRSSKCVAKVHIPTNSEPTCLEFSENGRLMVVGTAGGDLFVWDLNTRKYCGYVKAHSSELYSASFSKGSGSILASGGSDSMVKLWSVDQLGPPPIDLGNSKVDLIDWGVNNLAKYPVKYSVFYRVVFSPRNLLFTGSSFDSKRASEMSKII
ncbi:hypothetical protein GEMRC1_010424 [Eukaryota sp. GEM-RC1]